MKFKKHIPFLFVSLFFGVATFAQDKSPESKGVGIKNLSSESLEKIRKNKSNETADNIRVSDELMEMYKQKKIPSSQNDNKSKTVDSFTDLITTGSKVRVQIIATSANDVPELIKTLTGKGLTDIVSYDNFINAYIEVTKINLLEEITSITMVTSVHKPIFRSGGVQSQADRAIRADIARNNFGVNGHGIKIGILSDSYNALGGAVAGVNAGELPGIGNPSGFVKPVVVLKDFTLAQKPRSIDEGRAMAEIVHDVAPGAEIYFFSANDGAVNFANGIRQLANAGCKIIVDDVNYFEQPYFQDGVLARAVEDVTNQGVSYFTSAGNNASTSYEFDFKPFNFAPAGEVPDILQNFSSNPANPINNLLVFCPVGGTGNITLQWSQPFKSISGGFGARTDLDIFVLDEVGNILEAETSNNIGQDPVTTVEFLNNSQTPRLRVVILKRSGINVQKIKMVFNSGVLLFNDLANTPGLFASTITGQANASSAITVGAADYRQTVVFGSPTNIIRGFSSKGGLDILFNRFGGRTFERRFKPEIVAADNGNTSFFSAGFDPDNDGFPNFPGTSASAPHAAAVAALCLEASNCFQLSPFYVKSAFILNASDMDDPATPAFDYGFDFKTGNGFINAEGILNYFDFCYFNKNAEAKNKTNNVVEKKDLNEFSVVGLFPNPVKDLLNISITGSEVLNNTNLGIKIIDLTGKQIPVTPNIKGNIIAINVQTLTAGTYVVQVNKNGKVKNLSFIKQ